MHEAKRVLERRYSGSMRYQKRGEKEYLLLKVRNSNRSLGPRTSETDRRLAAFTAGKTRLEETVASLKAMLEERAPVLVALGLGRVPRIPAAILRRLDGAGLLGERLLTVGTHALFAYEAAAGVHIDQQVVATVDLDVLYDARSRMRVRGAMNGVSLIEVLRKADRSFTARSASDFRAVSDAGFMVDLIEPMRRDAASRPDSRLSDEIDDLTAAAIEGLTWLESSPRFEAVVIDEKGLPCWLPTIDPRAYALYKSWLAERPDRDPLKKRRDAAQAVVAATLAVRHLGLDLRGDDLTALPAEMRARADGLLTAMPAAPPAAW